jgi:hypothetical protein
MTSQYTVSRGPLARADLPILVQVARERAAICDADCITTVFGALGQLLTSLDGTIPLRQHDRRYSMEPGEP